ncbi:MAG: tyrosine-type recombinase/integrase [Hyphomicrobiaceae bacterium]
MDRPRVPRAQGRDRRRKLDPSIGLKVVERAGRWYVHGTVRIGRHSRRVRASTGLPARAETFSDADAVRHQVEARIRHELVHGVRPSRPVAIAADLWLRRERPRPLGAREVKIIKAMVARFGVRWIDTIPLCEWEQFVDAHCSGRAPATRRRWLNGLLTFLKWCAEPVRGWLEAVPMIERPSVPRRRQHIARRRVADLRPDLIAFLIDHASPHLAVQMWTMWSTGARVSSILFGCRLCDAILAEGRERITFHDTKNGDPVVSALHPRAADALRAYLEVRGRLEDREGPLFLDHRNRPYSERGRGDRGGQTKTALQGMRRRAIKTILKAAVRVRRAGQRERYEALRADARLLRQVTPHWLRHALATNMLALGADVRSVMDQAGWRDADSVMVYAHDVPAVRRRWVETLAAHLVDQTPNAARKA